MKKTNLFLFTAFIIFAVIGIFACILSLPVQPPTPQPITHLELSQLDLAYSQDELNSIQAIQASDQNKLEDLFRIRHSLNNTKVYGTTFNSKYSEVEAQIKFEKFYNSALTSTQSIRELASFYRSKQRKAVFIGLLTQNILSNKGYIINPNIAEIVRNSAMLAYLEFNEPTTFSDTTLPARIVNKAYIEGLFYFYLKSNNRSDIARAIYWLSKASYNGSQYASAVLGLIYTIESKKYINEANTKNYDKLKSLAASLLYNVDSALISEGDPEIAFLIGTAYQSSIGKDLYAIPWYERAYFHFTDYGQAAGRLSLIYTFSEDVAHDYSKARSYAEVGVWKNNPASHFVLGFLYENGFDVTHDLDSASLHYSKACELGNNLACDRYKIVEQQLVINNQFVSN